MDLTTGLLAFALTCLLIELTPGPNMAWLAILGATEGRARGLVAVAGVATGLTVVGLLAALGVAAVIDASPVAYQALRWGGALYLLWLAWEAWRGEAPGDGHPGAGGALRAFRRGLVTNLLNPKAAVFYLAVLPRFVAADAPVLPQTLALTAVYVAVATAVHAGIVVAASVARVFLTDADRERRVRRALAVVLAWVAIWFLIRT